MKVELNSTEAFNIDNYDSDVAITFSFLQMSKVLKKVR